MEHEHDVICHALLSHNNFFLSVDNKVASLVILTLTSFSDDGPWCHLVEMTELGTNHNWNFADLHLVFIQ